MESVIICHEHTPDGVRAEIEARPGSSIQWRDDDWRVSYGFGEGTYLDIMYLAEFNAESAWSEYVGQLSELIREHAIDQDVRDNILEVLAGKTFGLTVEADPDITNWDDDRLAAVVEYADLYGAFLATPGCLFDTELNALCDVGPWQQRFFGPVVENCTLYFPTENIPFKKLLPGVSSDGGIFKSPSWYKFRTDEGPVQLNVTHPDLAEHVRGFLGYVAQQPNPPAAREEAQQRVAAVASIAGVELPSPVRVDGSAMTQLLALVRQYDGFMFVADSIMLPDGTFLAGPMATKDPNLGRSEEPEVRAVDAEEFRHEGPTDGVDPARVAMRERHYQLLAERGFRCARWMPLYRNEDGRDELRPLREIAARVLALKALFLWASAPEDVAGSERVRAFIQDNGLRDWLTESERAIVDLPRNQAQAEHEESIGWRLENMWALSWILGFEPGPTFYLGQLPEDVTRTMVLEFLPDLDGSIDDLLARAEHRTDVEVGQHEDLFYCAHNAVRSAQSGTTNAVPESFHPVAAGGAVHERRHSLTWAMSPGVDWDETDLST